MSLTRTCVVHSNVDGLANFHCILYLTAVDPIHFTTSAMHSHLHITSGSVETPCVRFTGNSSSIGVEPVP